MRRFRKIGASDLPPPFPNGWYCILESSALGPGEVQSVSCLGEQFVVYRTKSHEVYVLDAYCPHMGVNMGIGGRVVGDNIECPFHQWSFRGSDGKCVNIPYSSCVPDNSRVRKWMTKEVNDNIFIWYHSEEHNIPWELPVVEEIENKELVFLGRNEFYVNCHIQEIPENGADMAHFAAIHNVNFLAGGINANKSNFAKTGTHHWKATWTSSKSTAKHIALISLTHSLELIPKVHIFEMDVIGHQIGPSYVQLHLKSKTFGNIEILQTVTPIEPLVQKVVHRFYARRKIAPIMKLFVCAESIMFERDMVMWNHKIFRNKPHLVKEDSSIKAFRNWYSQFYSENSKTFIDVRNNLGW
ncbi:cholesterol 7-desaturase isoform X2 [Teleopsis dalmanni]|nr:cholesterol 7-desaturase isoform X2 [Teleopsis dalmanni]